MCKFRCVICNKLIVNEVGGNARPVAYGRCCNNCLETKVKPVWRTRDEEAKNCTA